MAKGLPELLRLRLRAVTEVTKDVRFSPSQSSWDGPARPTDKTVPNRNILKSARDRKLLHQKGKSSMRCVSYNGTHVTC